jgi:medium-chain acyl-[acyl-carrier-protein] hydrolase
MTTVAPASRWIQSPKSLAEPRIRMFCLPYAGGGASMYRQWAQLVPADVAVHPIQLPGRENRIRETPYTSVQSLLQALLPELMPYLDRPFVLFGHSMGAMLAFELSRFLVAQRLPSPASLFVSGCRAPQLLERDNIIYDLPQDEFIARIQRLNGIPAEVVQHHELMELLIPQLRADFEIVDTYAYQQGPQLSCPIVAFGGDHDPSVLSDELAAWDTQTRARCSVYELPGDHFFIRPQQSAMLEIISRELSLV